VLPTERYSTGSVRQEISALRDFGSAYDRSGSWLCENSSARRARRSISKKLRIIESNDAALAMFDTLLENCIFYISPMYEFLHSQCLSRAAEWDFSKAWTAVAG